MIHFQIFLCYVDNYVNYSDLLNNCIPILSCSERDRLNRFWFLKDKLNFLIGRIILKNVLSPKNPLDLDFVSNNYGKLQLKDLKNKKYKFFNVSHTDNMVVVMFSHENEVGVDVEQIQCIDIKGLSYYCASEHEKERIFSSKNKVQEFYKVWTTKEAYLKAIGLGLVNNLENYDIYQLEKQTNIKIFQTIINNKYFLSAVVLLEKKHDKNFKANFEIKNCEIKSMHYQILSRAGIK